MRGASTTPRDRRFAGRQILRAGAAAALAFAASACAGDLRWPHIRTQRYPAPMPSLVEPLPPGSEARHEPGPEEVVVIRHADPVQLRPAGQLSAFPMAFYEKSHRVHSGSWVYCLAGGRAEVIWPNGATVALFGRTVCVIGSPSRGEPAVILLEIERADIHFMEQEQVRLLGGSLLTVESGPFVIERASEDLLRVRNQSKKEGELAFRDEVFRLEAGQVIDLPLLEAGGAPLPEVPGARTVEGPGFQLEVHGAVDALDDPGGITLRATGEHEIAGLGVRMELLPGEEARFTGLRVPPAPVAPSASNAVPDEPPADAIEGEASDPSEAVGGEDSGDELDPPPDAEQLEEPPRDPDERDADEGSATDREP